MPCFAGDSQTPDSVSRRAPLCRREGFARLRSVVIFFIYLLPTIGYCFYTLEQCLFLPGRAGALRPEKLGRPENGPRARSKKQDHPSNELAAPRVVVQMKSGGRV